MTFANLDEVVEEAHKRHRQNTRPGNHRLIREGDVANVGNHPADERSNNEGDTTHRRRPLLHHMVLRSVVVLTEDRLALAVSSEEPNQVARPE